MNLPEKTMETWVEPSMFPYFLNTVEQLYSTTKLSFIVSKHYTAKRQMTFEFRSSKYAKL